MSPDEHSGPSSFDPTSREAVGGPGTDDPDLLPLSSPVCPVGHFDIVVVFSGGCVRSEPSVAGWSVPGGKDD